MPRLVEVFDMENHDSLPLIQEPLTVLPLTIKNLYVYLHGKNMTAILSYLCQEFWIDNVNYVENLT